MLASADDPTPYAHAPPVKPEPPVEPPPPQPLPPEVKPAPAPPVVQPPSLSPSPAATTSAPPDTPAARPTPEPPLAQLLGQAFRLELAGEHDQVVRQLHEAGLPDAAAVLLQCIVTSTRSADPSARGNLLTTLETLEHELRPQAPLTVNKACFCKRVIGFGLYDPLPEKDLPAFLGGTEGRPGERVLLYLEVSNFRTATTKGLDGITLHETLLTGSLQIERSRLAPHEQKLAAEIKIPREVRPSRSPRQDYFMRLEFNIPPGLAPGDYKLSVVLDDETPPTSGSEHALRHTSKMLEFRVVEAR